jgi:hypothetical protein
MSIQSIKMGMAAAAAGGALILGGLFIGSSLVSAQTPGPSATEESGDPDTTPTTPNNQQTPSEDGKSEDGTRTPRDGECDKDGDGQPDQQGSSSSSSPTRTRGGAGAGSGVRF